MKTKIKLLGSSAIVMVAIQLMEPCWSMDDKVTDTINPKMSAESFQRDSLPHFTEKMYHNHLNSMNEYRNSVESLIGELSNLKTKLEVSEKNPDIIGSVQSTVNNLKEEIANHNTIFTQYDGVKDLDQIRKEINEKIKTLETVTKEYQNKTEFEETVKDRLQEIERLKGSLTTLDTVHVLRAKLALNEETLNRLLKSTGSSEIRKQISDKEQELSKLYVTHTKALGTESIISRELSSEILKSAGIPDQQVININFGFLGYFFARKLEFPYVNVQSGVDKDKAYINGLEQLSRYFKDKITNDIAAFDACVARMDSVDKIKFNFVNSTEIFRKLLNSDNKVTQVSEESIEPSFLKISGLIFSYLPLQDKSHKLIHKIISESPYGLLGLSMGALSSCKITSELKRKSDIITIKEAEVKGELPRVALDYLYNFLGNHINRVALDKILDGAKPKPPIPFIKENFMY